MAISYFNVSKHCAVINTVPGDSHVASLLGMTRFKIVGASIARPQKNRSTNRCCGLLLDKMLFASLTMVYWEKQHHVLQL